MSAAELMYVTGTTLVGAHAAHFFPADFELIDRGHVGHRTAGREIGQHHLLVRRAENVRALRHEVDAAEHDVVGLVARGGGLRQLQRIADDVGKLDDFVALVMVAENDEARAERGLGLRDARVHFGVRQPQIPLRQRLPFGQARALVVGQELDLGHCQISLTCTGTKQLNSTNNLVR